MRRVEGRDSVQIKNLLTADWKTGGLKGDRDLSELYLLGDYANQLTESPGWVAVEELLDRLHDAGMEALVNAPRPLDQATYSQRLGFLHGIRTAKDAATTIVRFARDVQREAQKAAEAAEVSHGG
jgi:hypothetical protein